MPVSLRPPSTTARTFRLCSRVRCAMLSASCSIETPAFTRRTLDWLRTSLLKGMSREGDSVIFWTFVICTLHNEPPGDSLLARNPSRKAPAPLTLAESWEGSTSRRLVGDHRCIRSRRLSHVGGKAKQIIRSLACLRRCTHDGAIIFPQDFEPGADVVGVANGRH